MAGQPEAREISAVPPAGAVVLLGADGLGAWQHSDGRDAEWTVDDGVMMVRPGSGSIVSRESFGDCTLHVEFMCPEGIPAEVRGQARSNSGVYLQNTYEVQILDSWGTEALIDGAGAIYSVRAPTVNAARAPGQWQSYDIEFTSARWDGETKLSPARLTVRHNGVLVQDDVEVSDTTRGGREETTGLGPILLQDHGNEIRFRNVWVLPQASWQGDGADGFDELINDSLDGWTKRGGSAVYSVDDGVVVGETRPRSPNTFLCTDREYSDFVLELEFLVDDELNSGVQIRSAVKVGGDAGRVFGYQIEIDPSERLWTAGLYDESGRGWLYNLEGRDAARGAFKSGGWNRLRVYARGDVIRTWLNDVPVTVGVDAASASGFIGLQVHGVGAREDALRVKWRGVRLQELD